MDEQGGTSATPDNHEDTARCEHISRLIARISDKWTMLVVRVLGRGPCRFNALRREVGEISQKVLASTLRELERNGFVSRTVTPTKPPQVEYALRTSAASFSGQFGNLPNGSSRTRLAWIRRGWILPSAVRANSCVTAREHRQTTDRQAVTQEGSPAGEAL
jgi:DNA-binding HxlR family transcriptional regulator